MICILLSFEFECVWNKQKSCAFFYWFFVTILIAQNYFTVASNQLICLFLKLLLLPLVIYITYYYITDLILSDGTEQSVSANSISEITLWFKNGMQTTGYPITLQGQEVVSPFNWLLGHNTNIRCFLLKIIRTHSQHSYYVKQ